MRQVQTALSVEDFLIFQHYEQEKGQEKLKFKRNRNYMELDAKVSRELQDLCDQSTALEESGDIDGAITKLKSAWKSTPEPKFNWGFSIRLLEQLCDVHIRDGRYKEAKPWHNKMLKTPFVDYDYAPFLIGATLYYRLEDFEKSWDYLQHMVEVGGKSSVQLLEPDVRNFYVQRAQKK